MHKLVGGEKIKIFHVEEFQIIDIMLYPQSLPSKVYNMEGGEDTFAMGKPKSTTSGDQSQHE